MYRPTRDSLFKPVLRDGSSALKVWNRNRCGSVVAAFNVQGADWDPKARRRTKISAARVTSSISSCDTEDCCGARYAALCVLYVGAGAKVRVPIALDLATLECSGGGGGGIGGKGGEGGGPGEEEGRGHSEKGHSEVTLVGSWDGWSAGLSLRPTTEVKDSWSALLEVVPGTYQFKFVVDGEWTTSSSWPIERDGGGNFNNFLHVGRRCSDQGETGGEDSGEGGRDEGGGGFSGQQLSWHLLRVHDDAIPLSLEPGQFALAHVARIEEVGQPGKEAWYWAAIGLEHPKWGPMFNAGGALLSAEWLENGREGGLGGRGGAAGRAGRKDGAGVGRGGRGGWREFGGDGGLLHISLYGPGTLLVYSSLAPSSVVVESENLTEERGGVGVCVVRELVVKQCGRKAQGSDDEGADGNSDEYAQRKSQRLFCQYALDTGALRVPLEGAGQGGSQGGLGAGGVYHVYIKRL